MSKKLLLLATHPKNGDDGEDQLTADFLEATFEVRQLTLAELPAAAPTAAVIFIRNLCPHALTPQIFQQFLQLRADFYAQAEAQNWPVYSELAANCDRSGKDYLLRLQAAGMPVIPTIDRLDALAKLPITSHYISKPKFGFSSFACEVVAREQLAARHFTDRVVQPLLDFAREISFYFVDGQLQYTLSFGDKLRANGWYDQLNYTPTAAEIAFAQRFVEWTGVRHAVQRIDALQLNDGSLLLLEIEDNWPYLSLPQLPQAEQIKILQAIRDALVRFVHERISQF